MVSPVIPSSKGEGQVALADTRAAWVNLRNGPGTSYNDVGDVRDNTLVQFFPSTRQGDWVYLEQYGRSGWVHTGFVEFEPVNANPPTAPKMPTPYDGHAGIWYWEGDSVQEQSIEEVVANLKRQAPNITQFWLKTSNGPLWQGASDSKKALSIDGPEDITRWGETLERYGIELHAWCVPRGNTNIAEETRIMIETCKHPLVKSLNVDVEPDRQWYWAGTAQQVRELMVGVRREIPGDFHISMAVDPRPWHYDTIFPDAWKPFINSIHPMVYWVTFRETPDAALQQMYDTWLGYGLPIVPILQADAPTNEIREAHSLATAKYGSPGLSWWRYGVASTAEMSALNLRIPDSPVTPTDPPDPGTPINNPELVDEILITPADSQFAKGTYTGQDEFRSYVQRMGWPVHYTRTATSQSKVWAMWTPNVEISGEYAVDVYIHKPFSTTRNARFKVHGVRGQNSEVVVSVNQNANTNDWYRLGVFDFDKNLPNSGRVFLNDLTGESNRYVTFDAVRYRRVVDVDPDPEVPNASNNGMIVRDGVVYCDGFDSPVGNNVNSGSRTGERVWQSGWRDASPYAQPYLYSSYLGRYTSVHTGADLNWGRGAYDDVGQEIYSIASGVVIFANTRREWGNLVVIQHDPYIKDGRRISSRYAHLNRIDVNVGDRVARGQQIGTLGGTRGRPGLSWVPHLHFDIMPASTMERNVEDWPPSRYKNGLSVSQMTNSQYQTWVARVTNDILKDYYNPQTFIQENRPNR
jgi:murein DD-endopeptidase MepM/ murein hydrolase activator NlpD